MPLDMPRKKKHKRIFVADCETDPFSHGAEILPFVWGVYSDSSYEVFENVCDFVAYISAIDCICYAHNGGKFDWHFLLDYIDDGENLLIINGRLSRFKIGLCEFRDSWNILPLPLAQMQKDSVDYSIFTREQRHKPENRKIILDYLYSDCLYLYRFVMGFVERHGTKITQASAAMATWKAMHPEHVPDDTNGAVYNAFSRFYYGGRCEAFCTGIFDGATEMYDINSAYPYAMTFYHPISLSFSPCHDEPEGGDFLSVYGTARGCFPFRDTDGSLIFPSDDVPRHYNVTGWEYIAATEHGDFCGDVVEHYRFSEHCTFSDYVERFFNERAEAKKNGDKINDVLCKLLLNSLYGKFGSNPDNYKNYKKWGDIHDTPDGWVYGGAFGEASLISKPLADDEARYYNVATAASITGFVRAMLYRCIKQSTGVLYCDTDSIVCAASDVDQGDALGQWKHEATFSEGAIAGKKLYAFRYADDDSYKVASKGVRLSAAEVYKVASGLVVTYKPLAPTFSVKKSPTYTNRDIKIILK